MPDMDGLQFCRRLKTEYPRACRRPPHFARHRP
jgi:CheY-like chemotaxis protein